MNKRRLITSALPYVNNVPHLGTLLQVLSADVGIPSGLAELGVKEEDLEVMAGNAQKDACGLTNPRCPKDADVIAIYTAAL